MPQLDTVYIFLVFTWTWLSLYLTSQKIKTIQIISGPKNKQPMKFKQPTLMLPWM